MKIFSVSELNLKVHALIRDTFKYPITIKGELVDARIAASGYQYFKLSENSGLKKYVVECAFFENQQKINTFFSVF